METEILKSLGSMGAAGALAGLMFMAYRQDRQRNEAAMQLILEQQKDERDALIDVIKENTRAITEMTTLLKARER